MSRKDKIKDYGLKVKTATNGTQLRYLVIEDGIPIPDVCLWLDLVSINSYLTGERYAYALLRYLRYLKQLKAHYKEVTSNGTIEEYVKHLLGFGDVVINIESKMTFSAVETNISVLKSFYHWLEDNQKVQNNPVVYSSNNKMNKKYFETKFLYGQIWDFDIKESILSRITYKKKRNHLKWYSDQEVESVIQHLPTMRDQLVFRISVETGMRIGEILGLKIEDFDPNEHYLKVVKRLNTENRARAKTIERDIPIYESMSEQIQLYKINERREADIEDSGYLFLNHQGAYKGNPLRTRNFLKILKDAGTKAGLNRAELRTHSGRSTRVQQLVEMMRDHPETGVTEALILHELGWSSIKTLEVYEKGYTMKQRRKTMGKIKSVNLAKKEFADALHEASSADEGATDGRG